MARNAVVVVTVVLTGRDAAEQSSIVVVRAVVVLLVCVDAAAMLVIACRVRAMMLVRGDTEKVLDVGVRGLAVRVVMDAETRARRQGDRCERGDRERCDAPHA